MSKMGEKRPIIFEIILIVAAFVVAAVFTAVGSAAGLESQMSSSIARIITGVLMLVIFRSAFRDCRVFGNPVYVLPVLLFAVWNLFYNLSSGAQLGGSAMYSAALITALAPAIFEEVLFRGIFIHNLKKHGYGKLVCLVVPALIFSLLHLTNIVGQDPATVLLQVGYSFVVGLAMSAVYIRNNSILEIMIAHFLIDFTNRIYIDPATSSTHVQLAIFVVLLVAEAVYAVWLTLRKDKQAEFTTP